MKADDALCEDAHVLEGLAEEDDDSGCAANVLAGPDWDVWYSLIRCGFLHLLRLFLHLVPAAMVLDHADLGKSLIDDVADGGVHSFALAHIVTLVLRDEVLEVPRRVGDGADLVDVVYEVAR